MNSDLLNTELAVLENPGLDTFDPRLSDIVSLIEDGKYLEAALQSEVLLLEEIYDIRIICYYLYGIFLESGVEKLAHILERIIFLINDNFEAIGPAKRREKTVQSSFKWLFSQILKKIQYEEKKETKLWGEWLKTSREEVDTALTFCDQTQKSLAITLEDLTAPVTEPVTRLKSWLMSFQELLYLAPAEVETPLEEEEEEEDLPQINNVIEQAEGTVETEGSYLLEQMNIKLETFQTLLNERKYHLAAIVSANINKTLTDFSPLQHMPKLFSSYMQAYAENIDKLTEQKSLCETVEWKCLRELYKTDLDSFMAFETNLDFSTIDDDLFNTQSSPVIASTTEVANEAQSDDIIHQQEPEEVADDGW